MEYRERETRSVAKIRGGEGRDRKTVGPTTYRWTMGQCAFGDRGVGKCFISAPRMRWCWLIDEVKRSVSKTWQGEN